MKVVYLLNFLGLKCFSSCALRTVKTCACFHNVVGGLITGQHFSSLKGLDFTNCNACFMQAFHFMWAFEPVLCLVQGLYFGKA
jgi:hypothetical protein